MPLRYGVNSCPDGYAMSGYNATRKLVACGAYVPTDIKTVYDVNGDNEPPFHKYGMHICPRGVMAGIDVPDNDFLCVWFESPF
jgi:hypothetical protein